MPVEVADEAAVVVGAVLREDPGFVEDLGPDVDRRLVKGPDLGSVGGPEGEVELPVLGTLGRGEPEREVAAVAEPNGPADVDRGQPERGEDGRIERPAGRHVGNLQRDVVDHGLTVPAPPRHFPGGPGSGCHALVVTDEHQPESRRSRLLEVAAARSVPLASILTTVFVVVIVYLAGRLVYKLREILLLMVVAGFISLLLNPAVVGLRRIGVKRRGGAVAIVTVVAVVAFAGLAFAFGYPLVNGITHLAHNLPKYVHQAEHGKGWLGHLVRKYHVEHWVQVNLAPKLATFAKSLSKPALAVGKGAVSLIIALVTIFVLVLLLLLEGTSCALACSA